MWWTSIVSYFPDSSKIAAIYAIITLIILKESLDNQKVKCMQDIDTTFKADMNEVCENRILYNYSTKLGYYDEHNNEESREYSDSLKNKTTNINDCTSDKNYFMIPYIYATHFVAILSTTAISLHLLPISFYLINKKSSNYFKEWDLFSYSLIYSFFNTSYRIQKFRNENNNGNNYFDYETDRLWKYVDKIMNKKVFYIDPYYLIKIKNIFGYGGLCHYTALFNDIKHTINNDVDIKHFRVKRNRNIFILVVYWILVRGMFLASLWKEIILLSIILISLFIKYGLIIVHERCYLKYFKKQKREASNNDTELIPLNNIDTQD